MKHEAACLGVLLVELHFPGSRSLKDKRQPLASLRDVIHRGYRASFSEVGLQDAWQRAVILITVAASSLAQAEERIADIERYLYSRDFDVARMILRAVDTVESLWDVDYCA